MTTRAMCAFMSLSDHVPQMVEKNNKKLKGADTNLMSLRQIFERVRTFWHERRGAWLAIDFEAWEMDSTVLTEYGWSCVQFRDGEEHTSNGHLIVKEHMIYTNSKYVMGCRDVGHSHSFFALLMRLIFLHYNVRTILSGKVKLSIRLLSREEFKA